MWESLGLVIGVIFTEILQVLGILKFPAQQPVWCYHTNDHVCAHVFKPKKSMFYNIYDFLKNNSVNTVVKTKPSPSFIQKPVPTRSYPKHLETVWNVIPQLVHLPFFSLIPEICCFASSKNCLISRSYSLLRELVYTLVRAVYALRSIALHQCINSVYTSSSRWTELCFGKVKSLAWKLRVSPASLPCTK